MYENTVNVWNPMDFKKIIWDVIGLTFILY